MAGPGTISSAITHRDSETDLMFGMQGAAVLQGVDGMSNRIGFLGVIAMLPALCCSSI